MSLTAARADDWPQWMGPRRDGVWREAGIVRGIPPGGLPAKWRVPVKGGYAGPAVVGGAGSVAVAFDRKTGRELWRNLSASEQGY